MSVGAKLRIEIIPCLQRRVGVVGPVFHGSEVLETHVNVSTMSILYVQKLVKQSAQ